MKSVEKNLFTFYNFALVVVKHKKTGKYLCVEESSNKGWWIPGGKLDHGESFYDAAHRETMEEAGVNIDIKGVLRIENTIRGDSGRMRVIFYAESSDDNPKSISDKESVRAIWCDVDEIIKLDSSPPHIRGYELVNWPKYIENGGKIYPCSILTEESEDIEF